jgi:SulP family sulfate permease
MGAGITVGIVALPLAMAFAIASGLKPEAGLWTAIIRAFWSRCWRHQRADRAAAGAFIVIVWHRRAPRCGGPLISTTCAGLLLFALGLLRLGNLVRFVPVSIVIGFTNGIAVLIALSQVKDALGLSIAKMPGFCRAGAGAGATHRQHQPLRAGLAGACLGGLFLWPVLFVRHNTLLLRLADGKTVRSFARIPAPVVAWSRSPRWPASCTAGGNHWHALWRHTAKPAGHRTADLVMGHCAPALDSHADHRAAGRHRVAPVRARGRQLATGEHHRKHDPNQELMAQGVANFVVPFLVACRSRAPLRAR